MKTIGILGGMSWESTQSYYRALNEGVRAALGGLHSAKICLYSVDFQEIESLQHSGRWVETAEILLQAAQGVEAAGADFLVIATNTMHKVAAEIEAGIGIPLLHIADCTGLQLKANGVRCVGLLGTRFTMEEAFYKDRLSERFGLRVVVPEDDARNEVHRVIYEELCQGELKETSRQYYLSVIDALRQQGAEAVILGCTEIRLLVKPEDTSMPLYDTTALHAQRAVALALDDSSSEL